MLWNWLSSYWKETTAAAVAVIMLVIAVAARSRTKGRVQVTLPDAIIASIAAVLTLFLTGYIDKFGVGPNGITVEKAIVNAARQSAQVTPLQSVQVTALPVATVTEAEKGGTDQLPELVRSQVQALEFVLGRGSYNAGAIRQYLETLTKYPFFRFVVFLEPDKTFFGMMEATKLLELLQKGESGQTFESFATLLNRATLADGAQLTKLPTFVPRSDAVKSDTNKKSAVLNKMEEKNIDWLPVLSNDGHLQGIADRSHLIASLILDVTKQLGASPSGE